MTRCFYHADLNEVQGEPELARLITAPAAAAPFDRVEWWQGLARHCGLRPFVAVARDVASGGIAVLPLAHAEQGLAALANYYSFRTRPLFSPGADAPALLTALAQDLKRHAGRIVLSGLPDEDGSARMLHAAFAAAGWHTALEPCDINHILSVDGRSYAQYLAQRPGPLRTTLKRKARKVEIALHTDFSPEIWAQYEAIYAQSWKPEEGSMAFLREFAMAEAAAGRLRLGVAYGEIDGQHQPVAAQVWTVEAGTAFIHKLAYVEAAKPLSPGTSLSAALFEQVIDRDRVALVDFGTGDDPYKRDWMEQCRPRFRLACANPAAPAQWPFIARSAIKRLARAIRQS